MEIMFWHTDSIKRFFPSEHEASRSTNFSNICSFGSELSPLTNSSFLFETLWVHSKSSYDVTYDHKLQYSLILDMIYTHRYTTIIPT